MSDVGNLRRQSAKRHAQSVRLQKRAAGSDLQALSAVRKAPSRTRGRLGDWVIWRLGDWATRKSGKTRCAKCCASPETGSGQGSEQNEGEIGRRGDGVIGRVGDWAIRVMRGFQAAEPQPGPGAGPLHPPFPMDLQPQLRRLPHAPHRLIQRSPLRMAPR
jgi:hypothetical protein